MIKSLATLLFTILAAAVHLPAAAQKPESRAEAVKIVADMRRLVMPGAIERTEAVRIGGIDQWISVRGVDRRNPVLLMIHGGPGYVSMPPAGISSAAGKTSSPWCNGTSAAPARPTPPTIRPSWRRP